MTVPQTNSESGGCLGVLVLMALVGGGLYVFDWNTFSSTKITHYSLSCPAEMKTDVCPAEWVKNQPVEYAVYAEQQSVVSQHEGQAPQRLTKCAVVNKNNWKCHLTSTGAGMVGYTDGQYWDGYELSEGLHEAFNFAGVRTVRRWEWVLADDPPVSER